MSYADKIFVETCKDILANGFSDKDLHVRPRWEDGTPAHTIKKFGVVNRYDLKKQFPILTIRRTYWKSALDEVLWIWQKKSNNVQDLSSHIWDAWADETGSIGKAYGYQMGVKHHYKDGEEALMRRYHENKDSVVDHIREILPQLDLHGQWSIDVMQNGNDFHLIDMAIAENSAFYNCVPEQLRRPSAEDWMPKIEA